MIDLGFISRKIVLRSFGRINKGSRNKKSLLKKVISIKRSILWYCISNRHFLG